MSVQLQLQLPAGTELGNTQTKYIVFKNSDLKTCRPRREVKLVQSLAFAHVVVYLHFQGFTDYFSTLSNSTVNKMKFLKVMKLVKSRLLGNIKLFLDLFAPKSQISDKSLLIYNNSGLLSAKLDHF